MRHRITIYINSKYSDVSQNTRLTGADKKFICKKQLNAVRYFPHISHSEP